MSHEVFKGFVVAGSQSRVLATNQSHGEWRPTRDMLKKCSQPQERAGRGGVESMHEWSK